MGKIKQLINNRDFRLECARESHEVMLEAVLMYENETVGWKEQERSRIKAVQMNNLPSLLCVRGIGRILNALVRQL